VWKLKDEHREGNDNLLPHDLVVVGARASQPRDREGALRDREKKPRDVGTSSLDGSSMRVKDIRVGQVFKDGLRGYFMMSFVEHDVDRCYLSYKKLWLWHIDQFTDGCQSSGGAPWEVEWPYELVA
jgi:hypothetical protein